MAGNQSPAESNRFQDVGEQRDLTQSNLSNEVASSCTCGTYTLLLVMIFFAD